MKIAGKWKKLSAEACAESYPDEIEFYDRPRFLAKKGPDQRFICWDAGRYETAGEDTVKLSTASDKLVTYRYDLQGDLLTFVDDANCRITYRRVG